MNPGNKHKAFDRFEYKVFDRNKNVILPGNKLLDSQRNIIECVFVWEGYGALMQWTHCPPLIDAAKQRVVPLNKKEILKAIARHTSPTAGVHQCLDGNFPTFWVSKKKLKKTNWRKMQ